MTAHKLVSPNSMLEAARQEMLGGLEPRGRRDWALIADFVAFNVASGLERDLLKIFKFLYDIPLEDELLREIADSQADRKRGG